MLLTAVRGFLLLSVLLGLVLLIVLLCVILMSVPTLVCTDKTGLGF